jgi:alanine racemase
MGFEPVMRVTALVTSCDVKANTATLGMGYGDGLLPLPAHTGWVAHSAGPLNIAEVGVEEIIVGIPEGILVTPGDIVTLWGGTVGVSPTAEQWASWGNTIGDEVVASLASHVPRRFRSD